MRPDTLSVILRSASFIALFQTAGAAFFCALFGRHLEVTLVSLRQVTLCCAIAAAGLLVGQYALEAARMADDMSGILDASLQILAMHSASGVVLTVRLLGLALVGTTVARGGDVCATVGVVGATMVAASFMLTGHTAAHPLRVLLAPLLTLHVTIVAFWFGALVPLFLLCARETPIIAGQVTAAFSRIALRLVPVILGAGLLLGFLLIRHAGEFRSGYGLSLLAKLAGFSALMGLAAWNKWRLGPGVATGDPKALTWFRRSLAAEYVLISAVLSITAVMTTVYSPQP